MTTKYVYDYSNIITVHYYVQCTVFDRTDIIKFSYRENINSKTIFLPSHILFFKLLLLRYLLL